ncbi:DUF3313 domain-containing protein [Motiliproteus coralliicola]|uniref:DUF3313 domain-containing protein n=1 Tax=Motiliproteus coralliicola TaxID=2283196 RepID=A0A369WDN8_9GAMM|nr:DUF3313 domain-containing protein [Motiliproteus coralliicola]RDE19431.1 DUF3313 domain-containing protein [Motiliproteus coralliicola]
MARDSKLVRCSRALLLLAASLALTACTSKLAKQEEFSGFLSDYSQLKPVVAADGTEVLRWTSPELQKRTFSKVMLDPVSIYPAPKPGPRLRSEVLSNLLVYLNKAIRKEVGNEFELVAEPGLDTLRVKAAITGVRSRVEDLAAYEYVPIALVLAGANTAAGTRDHVVELFAEGELLDSYSGERLAAGVRKGFGRPLENDSQQVEMENVRPVLDAWAKAMVRLLRPLVQPKSG